MDRGTVTDRASGARDGQKSRAPEGPEPERQSASGIPLAPHYGPGEAPSARAAEQPGAYPFTRGIYPEMYRTRLWTMRQYAGMASARETNRRFKSLLEHGQTGLSIAFDLPTQIGIDPDDPLAHADVGIVGVSCPTRVEMAEMFDGIPLDKVTTSMTINATAAVLLAQYLVVADEQGVPWKALGGTLQNDVLKEFVARGTYNLPAAPAMRLATDVMAFCAEEVPRFNAISVSGYHMREAGADAVQEAAFALANARAYVDACVARGMAVDSFAPRISWIFNTHNDLFEEVAKYRALRRIWATIMREEYGAKDPKSWMLRTHTQTGGSTLTKQQPENNIARAAFQALAAVLGGVQSMALSCHDEALAIPTEQAQQIALRTQQIIAHETGVTNVADPLAGSYLVEHLTDEIERRVRAELDRIEALGGAIAAIESGHYAQAIADSAYAWDQAVRRGDQVVVGVNRFQQDAGRQPPTVFRADPDARDAAIQRLQTLRRERSGARVENALGVLERTARSDENLLPAIIEAVRVHATVGEITRTLERVHGRHQASTMV